MPEYSPEHERILDQMMQNNPNATRAQMFGYPAYKINGKLGVSLAESGIVVKVGRDRVAELTGRDGVSHFEPQPGRVWKDWVLLKGNFEGNREIFDIGVANVMKESQK